PCPISILPSSATRSSEAGKSKLVMTALPSASDGLSTFTCAPMLKSPLWMVSELKLTSPPADWIDTPLCGLIVVKYGVRGVPVVSLGDEKLRTGELAGLNR